MNKFPVELGGAHGKRATFAGSDGCLAPRAQEIATAKAFAGPGTRQGTASPMPSADSSGAFTPDQSVQTYNGDPRNAY